MRGWSLQKPDRRSSFQSMWALKNICKVLQRILFCTSLCTNLSAFTHHGTADPASLWTRSIYLCSGGRCGFLPKIRVPSWLSTTRGYCHTWSFPKSELARKGIQKETHPVYHDECNTVSWRAYTPGSDQKWHWKAAVVLFLNIQRNKQRIPDPDF